MAFLAPVAAFAAANAGTISTVLGVASAGISGISAIQQGNYQAAVARNNAIIAEQNAARASTAAQVEQSRSDKEYAAMAAAQLASQAASGLDIGSRSLSQGRQLTRRTGRRAAFDIYNRGTTDSRNFLQDAANFRSEGTAAQRQGYMSAIGSTLSASASLLHQNTLTSRNGGRRPGKGRPSWYGS